MNHLYYGDNLEVMRQKLRDDTIDLCYIDPPFNSKRNYFQIYNNIGKEDVAQTQAFIDTWTWNQLAMEGYQEIITNYQGRYTSQTIELLKGLKAVLGNGGLFAYLISMTQRINEIQRILKPTGSFYLHCDPTSSHYLKLILDGVFCPKGGDFRNEVIWHYTGRRMKSTRAYNSKHDIIFFYVKSKENIILNYPTDIYTRNEYVKMKKQEVHFDEDGREWIWGHAGKGKSHHYKIYIDEVIKNGRAADDVWDISIINTSSKERLGYPTQKPEALLERIIQASSNENDIVLDAYCGCGTTLAVAQRLKRHWIGIDITYQSIAVILKRLEESFGIETIQLPLLQLNGIPRDIESARALANKQDDRLRKEFEKWAILTYSKNRAVINEKKGADKGVDGIAYMATGKDTIDKIIFQVKSGAVKRNDIATLNSDRIREQAEIAIFITLEEPTKPMREEALSAGLYNNVWFRCNYPRIQIVTIQKIIVDNKRMDLPLNPEILKTAPVNELDNQESLLEATDNEYN